jgi:hypothetical protein
LVDSISHKVRGTFAFQKYLFNDELSDKFAIVFDAELGHFYPPHVLELIGRNIQKEIE